MTTKKTGLVLFTSVILFATNSFSQIENQTEEIKKKTYLNSGGIDYRFVGNNSKNIILTYRRFFKESNYNLKGSYNFGEKKSLYEYNGYKDMLIFPTSDSTQLGIQRNVNFISSYHNLEIGIERVFKLRSINLVAGTDILLGRKHIAKRDIVSDALDKNWDNSPTIDNMYSYNHSTYYDGENLNILTTTRTSLTYGVSLNLGMLVDITDRLYASAFVGFKFTGSTTLKEQYQYRTELYKEHIPTIPAVSTLDYDQNLTLGLHYRF